MSGHSKWSTIKRKKEKIDSLRSKIFTKIGREISVAVKMAGPDISTNARLKEAILKAKANNLPNSNIDRIIKKAAGEVGRIDFENISYEGYGPEGIAIYVFACTNNKNRTASNLRHYFSKFGGNLGTSGCVDFLFNKRGILYVKALKEVEKSLLEFCVELSALDYEYESDVAKITVKSKDFYLFVEKLKEKGYEFLSGDIEQVPLSFVDIKSKENREKADTLIQMIEQDDDVQQVFTNYKLV